MGDPHYPTVDLEFIVQKILDSKKVIPESKFEMGRTTTFVMANDKPMHKRHVTVRHFNGQINFEQATGKAILFGFMGDLLEWYEENRDWKEGGYINK